MSSVRAVAHFLPRSRVPLCSTTPRCRAMPSPRLRTIPTRRCYSHVMKTLENTRINPPRLPRDKMRILEAGQREKAQRMRDIYWSLFPGTFVALPLSQCPRKPAEFVSYQYCRLRLWLATLATTVGLKLQSMPSWTKRPRWQPQRAAIVPTARALHRDMLEAFATGDRVALQRLCLPDFANKLIAAVDRRSPRALVHFQLVRYNKPLLYPRLMSRQIQAVDRFDKNLLMEQVVVAVASTQRTSRHDAKTQELIPGSSKQQDKIEYVVLSRRVNVDTYENGQWRIWGTMVPTTLEQRRKEELFIDREHASNLNLDSSSLKKP